LCVSGGKGDGPADASKVKAFGPGLEKGKIMPGKDLLWHRFEMKSFKKFTCFGENYYIFVKIKNKFSAAKLICSCLTHIFAKNFVKIYFCESFRKKNMSPKPWRLQIFFVKTLAKTNNFANICKNLIS
jgi:hypothetical protein